MKKLFSILFVLLFLASMAYALPTVSLNPTSAKNPLNTEHTITAIVQEANGTPVVQTLVYFMIVSGPNAGLNESILTGVDGMVAFTYTGHVNGTDTINASIYTNEGQVFSNQVTKEWYKQRGSGSTFRSECSSRLTVVSGIVNNTEGPLSGVPVVINCTRNNVVYSQSSTTNSDGSYSVVFSNSQCDVGDSVSLEALDKLVTGTVSNNCICVVNMAILDLQVPEFGVVAGAVALVGAFGIFAYKRGKNE